MTRHLIYLLDLQAQQLCKLHDPVNAEMGELSTTTIYVLNNDIFPNNVDDMDAPVKVTQAFAK